MMRFLLAAAITAVFSLPASDNFTPSIPCNLGDSTCPNWTVASGTSIAWNATAGSANPNGAIADDLVFWNADSFTAGQLAQMTVTIGTNGYIGPAVRVDASANGYAFGCGTTSLYKFTAGVRATLSSSYSACVSTDVVKLTAEGTSTTVLKVYLNGVQNGSDYSDSSSPFTSGSAGMWGYSDSGTATSLWTGDNVGGGGATFPAAIINNPHCCRPITVRFR